MEVASWFQCPSVVYEPHGTRKCRIHGGASGFRFNAHAGQHIRSRIHNGGIGQGGLRRLNLHDNAGIT
jgi:hypothetical protein